MNLGFMLAFAGGLAGCQPTIITPEDAYDTVLQVTPSSAYVKVGQSQSFQVSGGDGGVSFSVVSGSASGAVNSASGTFTATAVPGTVVVRVEDGRGLSQDISIIVYDNLLLAPATKVMAEGSSFTFATSGGVPPYQYSVISGAGRVTNPAADGSFTALLPGLASVRVTDVIGNTAQSTITVQPKVQFTVASANVSEGAGTAHVQVALSGAATQDVSVLYTVTGTATGGGTDHDLANGSVTIPAGQTSADIAFHIVDDSIYEGDETVILSLGIPTNASLGANSVHTLTIIDNDPKPAIQFAASSQSVNENVGTASIQVVLSGASVQDISVPYTVSGTATGGGVDYTLPNGTVTIPAGSTSATLSVLVVDDAVNEANETVVVTLGAPVNAIIGARAVHTLTILDNDPAPAIQFSAASQTVSETIGAVTVTVNLSAPSGQDISALYTVGGTATAGGVDHNLTGGAVTIPAGQSSAKIIFNVVDDALNEADETVTIALGTPSNATLGAPSTHTVTIQDNDPAPSVQFSAAAQSVSENVGTATITVSLSAVSGQSVSVPYAVSGSATGGGVDYTLANGTAVISAGTTSTTIQIPIVDDALNEPDETVVLTLGAPLHASLGANSVHTLTIVDNDTAPVVQFSTAAQSVAEDVGTATVTVSLSAVSGQDISVPYTVSGTATGGGVDYTRANGTVTIPAGSSQATLSIPIVDDSLYEPDETVILTLGSPTHATLGAASVHTLTIQDNDPAPTLQFSSASQTVSEAVGSVTVTVTLSAVSALDVSALYTVGGTATAGGVDHDLASGAVTIPAGQTSAEVVFHVVDDLLNEPVETVSLALGTPSNAALGTPATHTVSITDNDPAPSIQFSAASQSISENAGSATVTVTLSAVSGKTISVPYTVSGTATGGGVDYTLSSGTATVAAGSSSATIVFPVVDDVLSEANETAVLTMGAPVNATLGANFVHTVTITDNDSQPTLQFSAASQSVNENAGTATVTITLSSVSGQDISVPYTVGGTATGGGVDFTLPDGTATISAGSTSTTIAVPVVDDSINEANETVVITLGTPTAAGLGVNSVHTLTVLDNDPAPSIQFSAASQSVNESIGTATVTVTLSAVSGQDVSVPYTVGGTATGGGVDYTLANGTATINAGSTQALITIPIVDDTINEPAETVILTFGAPTHATAGATTVHTLTINDNDAAPTIQFSAASQSVNENAGTATVTVTLSAVSGQNVSVPYTLSGTATGGGADYTLANGTATINAGSTQALITIPVVDDSLNEPNETVILTMGSPTNGTLGATSVHTVTIVDNDAAPTLQFSAASQSVNENVGTATVTVTLSAVSGQNVSVPYTVSGTATGGGVDYTLANGTATINAGQTSTTITVPVVDDSLNEANETVILTMGSPTNGTLGATSVHTMTILDNDAAPTIQFSAASQSVNENVGTATVTVTLSAVSGQNVSVPYTVAGSAIGAGVDYTLPNGTATINAGATSTTITIPIVDDTLNEPNETIILIMGTPTNATLGANSSHTLTILDNDAAPTIQFSAASQSVSEAVGTATVTVTLSAASGQNVSVPYTVGGTATGGGVDYTLANGTATISAGSTSTTIAIPIVDDTLYEGNETVVLTMGAPTNATAGATTVHTLTITDNDTAPTIQFSAASQSVNENVGTATVTVTLSAASGLTTSVPYTVSGTATGGGVDYTLANGTATISAGATSTTISIPIVDDTLNEGNETVVLTMGSPTNGTVGANSTHTLTINDNDPAPTVNFSSSTQTVAESVGTVTVTVTLSTASGLNVTVPYTVSGTAANPADHNLANGSFTITAGATTGTITFNVVDDAVNELNETVILTMGSPTNATAGATNVHTVTINDNDQPTISVATPSNTTEGSNTVVTVTLTGTSVQNVTFNYATSNGTALAGTDYTSTSGSGTITAGQTSTTVSVPTTNRAGAQGNRTFTFTISSPANATLGTASATATIIDLGGGTADASNSTSVVTPGSVVNNGSLATVTITVKDSSGTALSGKTVTLTSSRGGTDTITAVTNPTNGSGQAVFTIGSNTLGAATLTASVAADSVTIAQKPEVLFLSVAPWAEYRASYAASGMSPGLNSANTSSFFDLSKILSANGALTGFGFSSISGWGGNGTLPISSASDGPYRLIFDGLNDYIDFGTGMNTATSMTLETWVRPGAVGASSPLVGNTDGTHGMALDILASGQFRLTAGSPAAYSQVVLADSPQLYFNLNESSGTVAANSGSLGAGYNGTHDAGVTLGVVSPIVSDSSGKAVTYTAKQTSVPWYSSTVNTFTIDFWVNPTKTIGLPGESTWGTAGTSNQNYVIFPNQGSGSTDSGAGVSVGTNGICVFEHAGNYMPCLAQYSGAISGWTHVAIVYNNRQPSIYVNGNLVRTGLTSTRTTVYGGILSIGSTQSYGPFYGSIDEMAMYPSALSSGRIQAHYLSGANGNGTQCVSTTAALANNWYHLAGVFNITGTALGLYVNGVQECTFSGAAISINGSTNSMKAGTNSAGTTFYQGALGEFRIFNAALTSTQVSNHLSASVPRFETVPAAPGSLTVSKATPLQLTLNWIDNASNETTYLVERSTDGTNFSTLAILPAGSSTYTDTSASNATVSYTYKVSTVNAAGKGTSTTTAQSPNADCRYDRTTWGSWYAAYGGNGVWGGVGTGALGGQYTAGAVQSFGDCGCFSGTCYDYAIICKNW